MMKIKRRDLVVFCSSFVFFLFCVCFFGYKLERCLFIINHVCQQKNYKSKENKFGPLSSCLHADITESTSFNLRIISTDANVQIDFNLLGRETKTEQDELIPAEPATFLYRTKCEELISSHSRFHCIIKAFYSQIVYFRRTKLHLDYRKGMNPQQLGNEPFSIRLPRSEKEELSDVPEPNDVGGSMIEKPRKFISLHWKKFGYKSATSSIKNRFPKTNGQSLLPGEIVQENFDDAEVTSINMGSKQNFVQTRSLLSTTSGATTDPPLVSELTYDESKFPQQFEIGSFHASEYASSTSFTCPLSSRRSQASESSAPPQTSSSSDLEISISDVSPTLNSSWTDFQPHGSSEPSIRHTARNVVSEWVPAIHLLTRLLRTMSINEVYVCSVEAPDPLLAALSLSLPRRLLYTGPCHPPLLLRRSRHLQETVEVVASGDIPTSRHRSAVVYLSRKGQEERVFNLMAEVDRLTLGFFQSVVFGRDLVRCQAPLSQHSTSWLQVSYSAINQSLRVDEAYTFTGSESPVFTPLGSLALPSTSLDGSAAGLASGLAAGLSAEDAITSIHVKLRLMPREGPTDFANHFIKVITMLQIPPYVMALPDHCHPDASIANITTGGHAGNEDDGPHHCRLAHEGWRRLYVLNQSSVPSERVAVPLVRPLYGGYLLDILLTLAVKLNFRVILLFPNPDDRYFGVDRGNGSFSGLVGALQRKEAELSLSPFTMTRDRLRVMDFSTTIDRSSVSLFVNKDSVVSAIGWNTYVLSFHWTAWLALLLLLVVTTLVFVLMVRRSPHEDEYFQKKSNVTFMLFSCLVQQGSGRLPITSRVQTVLLIFWFASIVLYTFYTARLTSFLTTSTSALPFRNLEAAMSSPGWRVGLLAGTSTLHMLRNSEGTAYEALYRESQRDPSLFVKNDEEGIQRMLTQEHFAYFCEYPSLMYLTQGNCSIVQVPGEYLSSYLHIGYSKRLPFAGVLNQELFKLLLGGVLEHCKLRWWGKQNECRQPSSYTELDFSNIVTAYLLLGLGTFGAGAIFVAEVLSDRWKRKQRQHRFQYGNHAIFKSTATTHVSMISGRTSMRLSGRSKSFCQQHQRGNRKDKLFQNREYPTSSVARINGLKNVTFSYAFVSGGSKGSKILGRDPLEGNPQNGTEAGDVRGCRQYTSVHTI